MVRNRRPCSLYFGTWTISLRLSQNVSLSQPRPRPPTGMSELTGSSGKQQRRPFFTEATLADAGGLGLSSGTGVRARLDL